MYVCMYVCMHMWPATVKRFLVVLSTHRRCGCDDDGGMSCKVYNSTELCEVLKVRYGTER